MNAPLTPNECVKSITREYVRLLGLGLTPKRAKMRVAKNHGLSYKVVSWAVVASHKDRLALERARKRTLRLAA